MKVREVDWVKNVAVDNLAFTGFAWQDQQGGTAGTSLRSNDKWRPTPDFARPLVAPRLIKKCQIEDRPPQFLGCRTVISTSCLERISTSSDFS